MIFFSKIPLSKNANETFKGIVNWFYFTVIQMKIYL